jgi:probable rRNA maturation factor
MAIHFFEEDTAYKLQGKQAIKVWIGSVAGNYKKRVGNISIIFCSDEYLLNINREYLEHDYYTDIITFDASEEEEQISGDIFISVGRVKENAEGLGVSFTEEMHRVIIHGILHLCGFADKSDQEAKSMRSREEACLLQRPVSLLSKS